jgi:hypothetical protein
MISEIADISQKIRRYGTLVTVRKISKSFNPLTGGVTESFIDIPGVPALFTNIENSEIDGTIIKIDDRRMLCSAAHGVIEVGDLIISKNVNYAVITKKSISPADIPLIYKLTVRKS